MSIIAAQEGADAITLSNISTNVFIIKALQSLLNEKDSKKRPDLKDACRRALELIKKTTEVADIQSKSLPESFRADKILLPLEIACLSGLHKLTSIALDCIQKLIAYGGSHGVYSNYMENEMVVRISGAKLVDVICDCFIGEQTDEQVELHIIKALLTTISSSHCPIHGAALLKAIRTVYNIFLLTKNLTNQLTAKSSLNQMINLTFQRMEANSFAEPLSAREVIFQTTLTEDARMVNNEEDPTNLTEFDMPNSLNLSHEIIDEKKNEHFRKAFSQILIENNQENNNIIQSLTSLSENEVVSRVHNIDDKFSEQATILEKSEPIKSTEQIDAQFLDLAKHNSFIEKAEIEKANINETNDLLTTMPQLGKYGLCVVCNKPAEHYCRDTKLPICSIVCKQDNYERIKLNDNGRLLSANSDYESKSTLKSSANKSSSSSSIDKNETDPELLAELCLKDGFLVFRAMCKLSIKTVLDRVVLDPRSHTLKSKILSLEMILEIVKNAGPVFQTSDLFINAVKQYLCLALTRNMVSTLSPVFELSLQIFFQLLRTFRFHLKSEIEILFTEMLFKILEMKNSTAEQKTALLEGLLGDVCREPQILVDLYLNYDCDVDAKSNIYERLISNLSKLAQNRTTTSDIQTQAHEESLLCMKGLECVQATAHSLVIWSKEAMPSSFWLEKEKEKDISTSLSPGLHSAYSETKLNDEDIESTDIQDDPNQFAEKFHFKKALENGIRIFNVRSKKGIAYLIEHGCIETSEPKTIAAFFHKVHGLDKRSIGSYLGDGSEYNIQIMHAFVDQMDFIGLPFVPALRIFLDSFLLPGEAQKIDRFMLKFAERYVLNNPVAFTTADTAYVLAYSVIMLNTDLHSPLNRTKITKEEFIRINRNVDTGKDISDEFLSTIFDDILLHELQTKDLVKKKVIDISSTSGRERSLMYDRESREIALKTEARFESSIRQKSKAAAKFFTGVRSEHVRPMFELTWMPLLAACSDALQTSNDADATRLSLEAIKDAIRICCAFGMHLEKDALVSTLVKFTFLNNIIEMKHKNLEAIKAVLQVGSLFGNYLGSSWLNVLRCVSELERIQFINPKNIVSSSSVFISSGPNFPIAGLMSSPSSSFSSDSRIDFERRIKERQHRIAYAARPSWSSALDDILDDTQYQAFIIAIDQIFTNSLNLEGNAIVEFVRCLTKVSWEEITNPIPFENPRIFSLQKIVEVAYYNMSRIRLEWARIWAILGEHFNLVGCYADSNISNFAIDSLRQLSMKFLEKDELVLFKFQEDFLKPFGEIFKNNQTLAVRDMLLRSVLQLIQAKAHNIKSGWRALFMLFSLAASDKPEAIVTLALEIVKSIQIEYFEVTLMYHSYCDFVACLVQFAKNNNFPKISLQAVELLKSTADLLMDLTESQSEILCMPTSEIEKFTGIVIHSKEAIDQQFWIPVLYGFYRIVMTCELEIRSRSLNYLFEILKSYGHTFSRSFWEVVYQHILVPIFDNIVCGLTKDGFGLRETDTFFAEWLSTTFISALRSFTDLFAHFFGVLSFLIDFQIGIYYRAINNENESVARVGNSCFQQFIIDNFAKFDEVIWIKITQTFVKLLEVTRPIILFDFVKIVEERKSKSKSLLDNNSDTQKNLTENRINNRNNNFDLNNTKHAQQQIRNFDSELGKVRDWPLEFHQIIIQCVLQLLIIQNIDELLNNTSLQIYSKISINNLAVLLEGIEQSYIFARKFNSDLGLRIALWKAGFMKQLPNLLKQETSTISCYILILFRMFSDEEEDRRINNMDIEEKLLRLCKELLESFIAFQVDKNQKEILMWSPVIALILRGIIDFSDKNFQKYFPIFYINIIHLLNHPLEKPIRIALMDILRRAGPLFGITEHNIN